MEIVIVIMWFGISVACIYLGSQVDKLKSTVKKQQEQIDYQNTKINRLIQCNDDLLDISKDIANKVISIEERVDKYTKIVE